MTRIFILITIVAMFEITGDILFKEWVLRDKKILLMLGIIAYLGATVCWAFSLKYQDLSKALLVFSVITLIIGMLVGILIYKEDVSTINIVGMVLGLIGIVLLEI